VESAIDISRAPRNPSLRTYLAGGGATAALVAAAVIVFVGVAAFVGFNGLPFGADDSPATTVNLSAGVPQAAATAAGPTARSVAATPATPSDAALAEILAALPPGAVAALFPGLDPGPGPGGPNCPGTVPPGGGGEPVPTSGAVGGVVDGVEGTAGDLGVDLPLGGLTDDLTAPIDKSVNDGLNGVGGLLGDPALGDKVGGSLNETTNGLLGEGGLTDSLLGGK
jgi:hypothetical protein